MGQRLPHLIRHRLRVLQLLHAHHRQVVIPIPRSPHPVEAGQSGGGEIFRVFGVVAVGRVYAYWGYF